MKYLVYLLTLLYSGSITAQYITNGSASIINCHCYQLTPASNAQSGSVWNSNRIDLTNSFDFSFDVFFGCQDVNGADGMVFMLQPISTSVGSSGGGLGFQGIVPSIGVMMDTYQNTNDNDPTYDHISINRNGDIVHTTANNLAGPTQIISGNDNAEDCQSHVVRIVWDAPTLRLTAYVDGVLRIQAINDIVNTTFGGNPLVYWGFTASTGGLNNLQRFCTRLNAGITTSIANNATCLGNPVTFTASVDAFIPITTYYWSYGDGTTSNVPNPPPHTYTAAGNYTVKFVITGADGCVSDTSYQLINIGAKPTVQLSLHDTCSGKPLTLQSIVISNDNSAITNYIWLVDDVLLTNAPSITSTTYTLGSHNVKLAVHTSYGCVSDTAYGTFNILPIPSNAYTKNDTCLGKPIILTPVTVLNGNQYNWIIDGVLYANTTIINNSTFAVGIHTIKHYVTNMQGCVSDTATGTFTVYAIPQASIIVNDTCLGKPITMAVPNAVPNYTYEWWVDGALVASTVSFTSNTYTLGYHNIRLVAANNSYCTDTALAGFTILNKPIISTTGTSVCFGIPITLTATLTNPPFVGLQYYWLLPNGTTLTGNPITVTLSIPTQETAKLIAVIPQGCNSDTIPTIYSMIKINANAGIDKVVGKNQTFMLTGSGNGSIIQWQPSTLVSMPNSYSTSSKLLANQLYTLKVSEPTLGCSAMDSVYITIVDTSVIYMPTAFSPNGDGTNDVLMPTYIGIEKLEYFTIYNRWGQAIFTTNNMLTGWNATFKNEPQPTGTYVYTVKATDIQGKTVIIKGTINIIR